MTRSLAASWLERATKTYRLVVDRLPRHMPVKVARRLITQGNAARDARLYEVAAALYEEALRFTPGNPRIHVQCGHMFKEARDFASAEDHYRQAQDLMPDDADLALQLGHFYRVAGRPEDAAAAYRRALLLNPGWRDVTDELARTAGAGDAAADHPDWIVPELLPRHRAGAGGGHGETVRVLRLGSGRMRSRGGMLKMLRGIEAIRGYCIAAVPIAEVQILIDREPVRNETPRVFPLEGSGDRQKYVFNIWHDFSDVPPGRHEVSLRLVNAKGKVRQHNEFVMVAAPNDSPASLSSDAVVPLASEGARPIEEQVNDLPSMVRPARRSPLPAEVRTILVQRADQLGDLVCSVPAIRRLRALFPHARIVGLLTDANADLARSLALFDEIVLADFPDDPAERRRTMTAERQAELHRALAPYAFDLAIDLGEGSDSRPLLLLSDARFLYGFKEREWPWLSAGFEMNARDPVNALEITPPSRKLLAMVETLGAMHRGDAQAVPKSAPAADRLAHYGLSSERPFVVLHTGARLAYSRWPGFPALATMLLERTALDVLILMDDPTEAALYPTSERLRPFAGRMPFDDFDTLLAFAAAFVGNDSGPKHLASLRGTKVVSLHMARLNWSEWGQEISGAIISRRVPCAGCAIGHDAEDCGKDYACIRNIRPEEVCGAVLDQLG